MFLFFFLFDIHNMDKVSILLSEIANPQSKSMLWQAVQ